MGFFDSVTTMNFKKDTEGRTLYYPWGYLGSGYIIKSQKKMNQIRKFHKKTLIIVFVYLLISFFTILTLNVYLDSISSVQLLKHIKIWEEVLWCLSFVFLLVYTAWYYFRIRKLIRSLQKTKEKLKITEMYKSLYKSSNLYTIIFLELFCLSGVGAGIWLLQAEETVFIDFIILGSYGFFAIVFGLMVFLKIKDIK